MYKIAFFCIPAYGHTNPTIEVVKELVSRGNEVWYFSFAEFKEKIESAGAHFIGCDDYNLNMDITDDNSAKVGKDIGFAVSLLVNSTLALDEVVCSRLAELHPDCVIADSMATWGKFAALKMGIPFISSTTTFAFNQYSAKIMKQSFSQIFSMIKSMPSMNSDVKRLQAHGYPVDNVLSLIQNSNDTTTIVYTSKEFQPFSDTFADCYSFVGPSIQEPSHTDQPKKNQRKTVYISLGTVNNKMIDFYKNCIKAFSDSHYDIIMSVGKKTEIAELGSIPSNFTISNYVNQVDVLQYADVFISHCGMNSANESLYYSVPLVLFPQTTEQGGVARRVSQLQAGVYLQKNNAKSIRKAVDTVLADPLYKENAKKISTSFHQAGGAKVAADAIIRHIESTKK